MCEFVCALGHGGHTGVPSLYNCPDGKQYVGKDKSCPYVRREALLYQLLGLDCPSKHPYLTCASQQWSDDKHLMINYVNGGDLLKYTNGLMRSKARIHPDQWLWIMTSLAEAAVDLWDIGAVHRDIKPENVLIQWARDPHVVLADMDLACLLTAASPCIDKAGTPDYQPPYYTAWDSDALAAWQDAFHPDPHTSAHMAAMQLDAYGVLATVTTVVTGLAPPFDTAQKRYWVTHILSYTLMPTKLRLTLNKFIARQNDPTANYMSLMASAYRRAGGPDPRGFTARIRAIVARKTKLKPVITKPLQRPLKRDDDPTPLLDKQCFRRGVRLTLV